MQEMSQVARAVLGKPEIDKLKAIGSGIRVAQVVGMRVLVKMIQAYTDMDRVAKEGLLVMPASVERANRPAPTIGEVLQVGPTVLSDPSNMDSTGNPIVIPGIAIMCSKFAGTDISLEGENDFKIISLHEVICTLEVDPMTVIPIKEGEGTITTFADLEKGA